MKYLMLLMALIFSSTIAGAKKLDYVPFTEPFTHYQAVAVKNHLKRVETVGGFLRWLEMGHSKKDIAALRKWIMKMNIPEDQYFPDYQVRGNMVYYGRFQMTLHEDHIVINKKKFPFKKGQPLATFVDNACKQLKCGSYASTGFYDPLFFGEAEAIADWLLYGLIFGGGYVIGRWGWPWQWFRRRRVVEEVSTTTTYANTGGTIAREEVVAAVAEGGEVSCQDGKPIICNNTNSSNWFGRNNGSCKEIPKGTRDDRLTKCEDEVRMIEGAAKENRERNGSGSPDGFTRATSSEGPNPKPEKLKPWERRHRHWH